MVQRRSPAGTLARDVRDEARVVLVERWRRANVRVIADCGPAARSPPASFIAATSRVERPSDADALVLHGSARRWTSCPFRQSRGKRWRPPCAAGTSRPQDRACANSFARGGANHQPVDRATKRWRRRRSVASDAAKGGDRTTHPRDASEAGQRDERHRRRRHERVRSAAVIARHGSLRRRRFPRQHQYQGRRERHGLHVHRDAATELFANPSHTVALSYFTTFGRFPSGSRPISISDSTATTSRTTVIRSTPWRTSPSRMARRSTSSRSSPATRSTTAYPPRRSSSIWSARRSMAVSPRGIG